MTPTVGHRGEMATTTYLAERASRRGETTMGGSQLGLSHVYAEARHRDFVRDAERNEAARVAESVLVRDGRTRMTRLRMVVGGFLILLGERVCGARSGEPSPVSTGSLRLAR